LQAAAIGLADDDDVPVAELGTRDPAARDVVDVRAIRRALIDRDEPALIDSDPHVLAGGAMVVDDHVGPTRLATDDDPVAVNAKRWPWRWPRMHVRLPMVNEPNAVRAKPPGCCARVTTMVFAIDGRGPGAHP